MLKLRIKVYIFSTVLLLLQLNSQAKESNIVKSQVVLEDDISKGEYLKTYIKRELRRLDKNKDGQLQKEEYAKSKLKKEGLDKNNDQTLSQDELLNIKLNYLETGGKRMLNVLYKKTKEEDLYIDIYYPENIEEAKKLPVVFYTHGGGWANGSKHGITSGPFSKVSLALLKKGFCVVSINYRKWVANGTTAMRHCVIDSKDAMRFLAKNHVKYGIDTKRFFSFGDSAGGHISQMLLFSSSNVLTGDKELANYSYTMAGGVSWYGPCDFQNIQLFNYDNRENFRDRFGLRILNTRDITPNEKEKLYKEMSPISYLTKNSAPLLMIQGDMDTTIPVKHAYKMQKKIKEFGSLPIEILIVKNAGHNWREANPGTKIIPQTDTIIEKTIEFLANLK